jgi:hypothetical protein
MPLCPSVLWFQMALIGSRAAYTARPLLLICLDVKLSDSEQQKLQRKQDLWYLAQAMRQYGRRYQFAKFVTDAVHKVIHVFNEDWQSSWSHPAESHPGRVSPQAEHPRAWRDLYMQDPHLYFKLLFSLDYALSYGKMPSPAKFLSWSLGQPSVSQLPHTSPPNGASLTSLRGPSSSSAVYLSPDPTAPGPTTPLACLPRDHQMNTFAPVLPGRPEYAYNVSRAVDLGGGCEEIERSGILNNWGNNTI